ncbi:MAG: serine protease [Treponema sp.]|nr:serine protease [Treponema sp.]
MKRHFLTVFFILTLLSPVNIFSQQAPSAGVLRDYVGLINQTYHPGIVAYFEKMKDDLDRRGESNAVKGIEIFLRGATGSGFIIEDAQGNLYVITNNHVISQAHSLSITFERQDGFKKQLDNLRIIAADEEADLALLAFADGDKPMDRGLSFLSRSIDEGEDVYAAGFPALGATSLWQFSRGMVSNAFARFPKSVFDETLIGPFIQHTAQIDPGNSGGPLLVIQQNVPAGYAVAGINTLSGLRRQAANYAVPAGTAQTFIDSALNPKPETYRAALDQRLTQFVEGLGVNRAVYPHIAEYLSTVCVGENAEYAMSELYERGNVSVRRAFIDKFEDSVVGAMGYAVAWVIEGSIRSQGVLRSSVKEVTGDGEEYTVVFSVNDNDHESKWLLEHGNWRIRSFGSLAAGDQTLISRRQARQRTRDRLRLDSDAHIEIGYANLFDKAPAAMYLSADFFSGVFGAKLIIASADFWSLGCFVGYRPEFSAGKFGIMPYARIGIDFQHDQEWTDYENQEWGALGFPLVFMGQAGLKITSSYAPGLFFGMAFQYNIFNLMDFKYDKAMKMALSVTIGYAF